MSARPAVPTGPGVVADGAGPSAITPEAARVDVLTDINLADLLDSVGLERLQATPLRHLLRPAARRFARMAAEFDARVGLHGLSRGGDWLVRQMTAGLQVTGLAHVPAQGPVVILSNHPGMTDTVALFSALASRPDLRVMALDRPFLRALPHVARQLIFLPEDAAGLATALRAGARHLKDGGALLTFPAGEIEPDPATFGTARAIESLGRWTDSYALFARLAPRTQFVPALVSGVISADAQRHPLTRLRRTPHDREKMAAALQITLARYRGLQARLCFGPALTADAHAAPALCAGIAAQMRALILRDGAAR
ncbi:MAG: 1-acyl-sn-glycerol-3-phosphate acyltransferase [Proteobacteria bacterium]|nr:1-acyl-sn-glycerol-3-phosphate acyltransferase [Pseudomonadota bacterium]